MSQQVEATFKNLLEELFQLDKPDLDFGIYRILNLKSKEVRNFLDTELKEKIDSACSKVSGEKKSDIKAEIGKVEKYFLDNFGTGYESLSAELKNNTAKVFQENKELYLNLKSKLEAVLAAEDLKPNIYNDLYKFFNRYYEGGDFLTQPRAGDNTYMIPYNGEEVKLHWATSDQYYIKTGENFKSYIFHSGEENPSERITVEFALVEVDTGMNNNKSEKGRCFVPAENYFNWNKEIGKLVLNFHYKQPTDAEKEKWGDKQCVATENKGINEKFLLDLQKKLEELGADSNSKTQALLKFWERKTKKSTRKNGNKQENTIRDFEYHLNRYTTVNKFDYFIHKDLAGFLKKELDYFIKHEVFSLQFLTTGFSDVEAQKSIERNVLRAKVIYDIATYIIEFLGELEEFQKRLFEKKKFVVQSDYCITLNLISKSDTSIYAEVIKFITKDTKQIAEWASLGFLEKENPLSAFQNLKDSLKERLPLDTAHLPHALKWKLLASIPNLDQQTEGLLIKSENFQALNLLQAKYKEKVQCVYIDPPYNTGPSEIIYKNEYKHSSWLTLMDGGFSLSKKLLADDGGISIAIDDNELDRISLLIQYRFANYISQKVIVNHYPGSGTGRTNVSRTHEYNIFVIPDREDMIVGKKTAGGYRERGFRRAGTGENNYRTGRPNSFFAILIDPKEHKIKGIEKPPENTYSLEKTKEGLERIYPIGDDGAERVWSLSYEGTVLALKEDRIRCSSNNVIIRKYNDEESREMMQSVWLNNKFSASANGTNLLTDMFGDSGLFSYPKSYYTVMTAVDSIIQSTNGIILDYFAGSGTTGHAVINLNRDDEGNRKYILVEMGEYFDTVTKPRILKVIYSEKWKDGKPVFNGGEDAVLLEKESEFRGHIFQYMKLEQYEDALNNIEFLKPEIEFDFTENMKYALQMQTQGSVSLVNGEKFEKPFSYSMQITEKNERVSRAVDLVTTFNYLLGLEVSRYIVESHQGFEYRIVLGVKREEKHIVIWREFGSKLDLATERDWTTSQSWYDTNAKVYANTDNLFGALMIESEFRRLMFEGVK